jgi:DNA-directed RNA polymerase specialized sigma24 family protein
MEGFSVDEIAVITDRTPDDVRSSIVSAQDELRRTAPLINRVNGKLRATGTG